MFIQNRRTREWKRILDLNRPPLHSRPKRYCSIKVKKINFNTVNNSEIVASLKNEQMNECTQKLRNYIQKPYVMTFPEQEQFTFNLL
jgi:hypothetical protein